MILETLMAISLATGAEAKVDTLKPLILGARDYTSESGIKPKEESVNGGGGPKK